MRVAILVGFRRVIAVLAVAVLGLSLVPVMPAGAAEAASVAVEGVRTLAPGVPGTVTVTVAVADDIDRFAPIRLMGTTSPAAPAPEVALGTGSDARALDVDDAGRFVVPPLDQPPMTVAAIPDLLSGHTIELQVTVPDRDNRQFDFAVVESNEQGARVDRHAGADRYQTAASISAATFQPGVGIAYIARGDAFADALAAGPGAGLGGHPVLLSGTNQLPDVTAAELQRLAPARIIVLGGPAAIAESVVDQLRGLTTGSVDRLSGPDRYATAAAVALATFTAPVSTVVIASGERFPDALSGGPLAALSAAPILLVSADGVPQATADALRTLQPTRIIVLGGPGAVSPATIGTLSEFSSDITRLYGADRFATSAAIARHGFPDGVDTVVIATGDGFPDALAGVPAAIAAGAPLLLVQPDAIPQAVVEVLATLKPTRIIILGGLGAVGIQAGARLVELTRGQEPDMNAFAVLAHMVVETAIPVGSSGNPPPGGGSNPPPTAALNIVRPSTAEPATLRPGDRFAVEIQANQRGDFVLGLRDQAGTGVALLNPTATGSVEVGPRRIAANAPLAPGTYDIVVSLTDADGTKEVVAEDAVTVGITFPPPLVSGLVEDVAGQSQLVAVRPVGGLAEGTQLQIRLGSAERANVDYPASGDITLLEGTGTATLAVARDQVATINYIAGPADQVPGDDPTAHPLLTFRIDGIDVGSGSATHIATLFRYDIFHGVSRTFTVGAGSDVAIPAVSDLPRGSDHTFQTIDFGLPTPLPPFGSIMIDLGDAEQTAVDYVNAFAFLNGGGGHGGGVSADVVLDVVPDQSAILTIQAGAAGIPSVNGEGPLVSIFIGAVEVNDVEADPMVSVSRADGVLPVSTTFHVGEIALANATASNLQNTQAGQQQILGVDLQGSLQPGADLAVELPLNAAGVDYSNATVTVSSGNGTAQIFVVTDYLGNPEYSQIYYASDGDSSGTHLEFTVDGVDTVVDDRSLFISVTRYDTYNRASALFDVGAGSAVASPTISDLASGESDQQQQFAFAPREAMAPGDTIVVDLSALEAGGASYVNASGYASSQFGTLEALDVDVVDGVSAFVTYTAGPDGVQPGSLIQGVLSEVAADRVEESATVSITRDPQPPVRTTVSIRRIPGLTAVQVSDLESGTLGQTQTISFEVVGDFTADRFGGLEVYLEGPEVGAVRYGGAEARVLSGSGTVDFTVYPGYYAYLYYVPGPDGDPDGTVITLELVGVNTDVANETHRVDVYRYDTGRSARGLFDVGSGGQFLGRPYVDGLGAYSADQYQYMSINMVTPLEAGQTITVDLGDATAAGVSYADATATLQDGTPGSLALSADGLTLTYTASGRVRSIVLVLSGVATGDPGGPIPVTFTGPAGDVVTSRFWVYDFGCHECGPV